MRLPVDVIAPIPKPGDAGYFGVTRKFDVHTGIDLYTNDEEPVYAIYHGTVVAIEKFTGEHANSPWWENTFSILVENEYGVIVYGELIPVEGLAVGDQITEDQRIGNVKRVLKRDKGSNPTSMLHIEYYTKGTRESCIWQLDDPQPSNLLNPEVLFSSLGYFKYVRIFPDYGATGIWNYYGQCVQTDELPVSIETKKLLFIMQQTMDTEIWDSYGTSDKALIQKIDDMTMAAVNAVKAELPEWIVEYALMGDECCR